jgi:hypothetical protein
MRDGELGAEERPAQVDGEGAIPVLDGEVGDLPSIGDHRRIVVDDIEAVEDFDRAFDRRLYCRAEAIAMKVPRPAAVADDLLATRLPASSSTSSSATAAPSAAK